MKPRPQCRYCNNAVDAQSMGIVCSICLKFVWCVSCVDRLRRKPLWDRRVKFLEQHKACGACFTGSD